jgi:hypothetical protein
METAGILSEDFNPTPKSGNNEETLKEDNLPKDTAFSRLLNLQKEIFKKE